MLVRGYKGKEADRLLVRIAPGVVSLVAELRGHGRQAAEELEQGKNRVEEHKLDASPAAITLAMICTRNNSRSHRPRDQQPQFPRRRSPKTLGSAARRPGPDPGPAGRGCGRSARRRNARAG